MSDFFVSYLLSHAEEKILTGVGYGNVSPICSVLPLFSAVFSEAASNYLAKLPLTL